MMSSLEAIGLTLATHPFQVLLAVVALYYAVAPLFGSRISYRDRPPASAANTMASLRRAFPVTGSLRAIAMLVASAALLTGWMGTIAAAVSTAGLP